MSVGQSMEALTHKRDKSKALLLLSVFLNIFALGGIAALYQHTDQKLQKYEFNVREERIIGENKMKSLTAALLLLGVLVQAEFFGKMKGETVGLFLETNEYSAKFGNEFISVLQSGLLGEGLAILESDLLRGEWDTDRHKLQVRFAIVVSFQSRKDGNVWIVLNVYERGDGTGGTNSGIDWRVIGSTTRKCSGPWEGIAGGLVDELKTGKSRLQELEKKILDLQALLNKLRKEKIQKPQIFYWELASTWRPIAKNPADVLLYGQSIPYLTNDFTLDMESTLDIDFSSYVGCEKPWNSIRFAILINQKHVGNIVGCWNTAEKGAWTVTLPAVEYNVMPGKHKVEVKAIGSGNYGMDIYNASLRIRAYPK